MKYQSLFQFYWFGTCLRYLQEVRTNTVIHGPGNLISNLEQFFKYLDDLKLTVTSNLAHRKLDDLFGELKAKPDGSALTLEEGKNLSEIFNRMRDTLDAEISGIGAYTPTPKRLDLSRLLNDVTSLFTPNVFDALPPIARFDFVEAGKCIAFERPTAGAFHILRATEDVLRFYYSRMIRSGRIKTRMWGPVVADLKKRNLTRSYEPLNNHLDNIRTSFRNPTQHPEATYDIHEVQDLWAVCVDVVNRMMKTLKDENRL